MYYDLLAQIKNAAMARKDKVVMPFSRMDFAVATVLAANGYIRSVEKETANKKSVLVVRLGVKGNKSLMNDFKIMSKPSKHAYAGYEALHAVKQGYGIGVVSTSKGIMTTKDAKKQKVGGEYLFEVW